MKVYVNYVVTKEYSFTQQENEEKYLNILNRRFITLEEDMELEKLVHEAMAKAMVEDSEYDHTLSVSVEDKEGNEYTIYEEY